MPPTLSPEHRLLTQAARPLFPVAAGPVDWDVALRQARRHRLAPLLSRHLETAAHRAPAAVVAELTADRRRTAASNLRLLAAGRTIVDTLSGRDVPVVALKGLALLEVAYDDLSLRPMVDIDLLVPDASIQRAEDLVLELGYRSARPRDGGFVGPRGGSTPTPS